MNSFSLDQKTLFSVLSWMQPICTKRTPLDLTTSLLFQIGYKEVIIKGTDLEVSLQATCPVINADLLDGHQFLVSGKRIYDMVKELEGIITFSVHANQLHIKTVSIDLTLNIKDAEGFPPFPERIENAMQIPVDLLQKLLEKVSFLIPQNNANPALNGLLLEIGVAGLTMTTTDGHSLAQVQSSRCSLTESKKWLIPRRAIFEVKKLLESADGESIFIGLCNNQLVFSGQHFNFFTKLLANQFPEYLPILQKDGFIPATIDRASLIKTLRRSVCLLSGSFIATQFLFDEEILQVHMHNKEVGKLKEALPLKGLLGAALDIRFYAPYLLSGLQAFDDDHITFYVKGSARPIMFQASHDGFNLTYLVMPVSPSHGT